MLQLDVAADRIERRCVGRIANFRLVVENLEEARCARRAALEHRDDLAGLLDRRDRHAEIEREGGEGADRHLAVQDLRSRRSP